MNMYVILSVAGSEELEMFSEEAWNTAKERITPERIIYVTPDLNDERLSLFDSIVWGRIFNPILKQYQKIKIPFTKDIEQMNKEAENYLKTKLEKIQNQTEQMQEARARRIEKKKMENLANGNIENLIKSKAEMDEKIPMSMNEFDALALWKKLSFKQPAGHRIEQIKQSYEMSWNAFRHFVDENF